MDNAPFYMRTADVARLYVPVYPESGVWADTIEHLLREDREVISELTEAVLKDGGFREAVALSGRPDEMIEGEAPHVLNGTHRVCVALLTGLEHLKVQYGYNKYLDDCFLMTTIDVQETNADVEDAVFDVLHSFPINSRYWATASTVFGVGHHFEISWEFDVSDETLALMPEITRMVKERLQSTLGEDTSAFKVVTSVGKFDD